MFTEKTVEEISALSKEEQTKYFADKAAHEKEQLNNQIDSAIEKAKDGLLTKEDFESEMTSIKESISTLENKDNKDLLDKIESQEEKLKAQGTELAKLKEQGLINTDLSVNKGVLRSIVEDHLTKAGLIGEEVEEKGIKVKPVTLKSNQRITDSSTSHTVDLRKLSRSHIQKAGENMYVTGTGTQSVFNQAINRSYIGEISDPLTANEHALDIFGTTAISGSLMTLMVYENLEANGELVAEGAAPSADSRVELTSKDFKVFDFSATATISKDLLRDSDEVIDELVRQLQSNLKTVLDNILFVSTGDNSATPWGVFNTSESCELFNPLLFAGSSPKANIISVIGKAKLQARLNDWKTDQTILNPNQWDEIEDLKDADENSIKDNRLAVNSVGEVIAVKGMMKYQTTKMPSNSLLVCNSLLQCIGLRQAIETEFGHNEGDLKKRNVSFVMDMRGAYGQKAKKSSIYVDDIAEAISILKEDATALLARINAYAVASDASPLTIAILVNAGGTSVKDSNLAAYKTAIAAETGIANVAALQAVIDTVNAA